ncbi:MAG TPA: adenylate/guanylate cyclase domain-containing protein [Opitutaceae bacterium]|nr:adenylate/guanylate cyclase domain-containing protein [Opitutaceae bacterium]
MPSPRFQFHRFGTRLLALLLGLLFVVLATTYALVARASRANAQDHAAQNLAVAAGIFDRTVQQRIEFLAASASLMTGDFTIKRFFLQAERPDFDTLSSTLESYTERVDSTVIVLLAHDEARTLLANSDQAMNHENLEPFRYLSRLAAERDEPVVHGFSYLNGQLSVLVVVPLYAPRPKIAAWFGLTFPIDRAFAEDLKRTTRIEVTFVSTDDPAQPRVLATTLPEAAAAHSAIAARQSLGQTAPFLLDLPALSPDSPATALANADLSAAATERYVTLFKRQPMLGENAMTIVLQRPLRPELAAARELQKHLLWISLAAFALATVFAFWISRGVSRPVLQLAAHTHHIAAGDYARRIEETRADELGQLARAFNRMSAGLAERDRIRDLLDKNVSPEVAAQLLRDGATLGGEEREVTILFADLRGFTTLSEKFAPRDVLNLLNRYLDRMSAEIEKNGGVIDKFIGDAIMALFGAPVAQGDAADRALAAALAMERALAELNRELAAEGKMPLALGIGINTARVVAGNIGSHRRLNYSVIGDGVNVAARLQALTRTPEYRTNIITSAATVAALRQKSAPGILPVFSAHGQEARATSIRPLGSVHVKGRAEPVEIFAVEPAV